MSISRAIDHAISRYGRRVELIREGQKTTTYALVEPLRRKHRLFLNEDSRDAGRFDASYRHYVGLRTVPLTEGDELSVGGEHYTVIISEEYSYGEEVLYIWAILKKKTKGLVDDYEDA